MLPSPPLRTVRASFPAHGSSNRQLHALQHQSARPLGSTSVPVREHTLHVCDELTVTFSPIFVARPIDDFGQSPVGSQRPFGLAIWPIQPVMNSRCLSATGIRLLRHPIPSEEFHLAYAWPTRLQQAIWTSLGLPRSASRRPVWFRRPLSSAGWSVSTWQRAAPLFHAPEYHRIVHISMALHNEGSNKDSFLRHARLSLAHTDPRGSRRD